MKTCRYLWMRPMFCGSIICDYIPSYKAIHEDSAPVGKGRTSDLSPEEGADAEGAAQ